MTGSKPKKILQDATRRLRAPTETDNGVHCPSNFLGHVLEVDLQLQDADGAIGPKPYFDYKFQVRGPQALGGSGTKILGVEGFDPEARFFLGERGGGKSHLTRAGHGSSLANPGNLIQKPWASYERSLLRIPAILKLQVPRLLNQDPPVIRLWSSSFLGAARLGTGVGFWGLGFGVYRGLGV